MPKEIRRPAAETRKQHAHRTREGRRERILFSAMGGVLAVIVLILGVWYYQEAIGKFNANIAVVNGKGITVREFQQNVRLSSTSLLNSLSQITANMQQAANDPTLAFLNQYLQQQYSEIATQLLTIGTDQLDQLIDNELVRQEAAQRGITVSADEVEEETEQQFGYQRATRTPTAGPSPTATRTSTPTRTPTITPTFTPTAVPTITVAPVTPTAEPTLGPTSTPAPTATPLSYQGYQEQKKKYLDAAGKSAQISDQDLKRAIETFLLRRKLQEAISKTVTASEEQVQARHILVKTYEDALQVQDRLKKGEDFAKVAEEVSEDTGSKGEGGDLGWFPRGQMIKEFEDAAFTLPLNQISQPITSTYGVHLIQVTAKDANRPLEETALQAKQQTAFSDWLRDARLTAKIEKYYKDEYVPAEVRQVINQIQSLNQR